MHSFYRRLKRSIEKTWPETACLLTGRAPRFVYGGSVRGVPVFTYHAVDDGFEQDLLGLREGRYTTIGAQELEAVAEEGRPAGRNEIALTFDDGDASLVNVAVPLLSRHGFVAVAFVVSGLVPPRSSGRLAGWEELRAAVDAGVLQVGSHSLYHHQVPVGPRVVGFVEPHEDTSFCASLPVPRADGAEAPASGFPILRGIPRYLARRAFHPDPASIRAFSEFVAAQGPGFSARADWRSALRSAGRIEGQFETLEESDRAVFDDMRLSMELIERHCPNPASRHLCYPWYAGDERADRIARGAGVRLLYGGVATGGEPFIDDGPRRVRRLPQDFLRRLPGPRREPLGALLARRARVILTGPS